MDEASQDETEAVERRLAEIREIVRVGFGPRWCQGVTRPVLYDAAADLLGMLDAERNRRAEPNTCCDWNGHGGRHADGCALGIAHSEIASVMAQRDRLRQEVARCGAVIAEVRAYFEQPDPRATTRLWDALTAYSTRETEQAIVLAARAAEEVEHG